MYWLTVVIFWFIQKMHFFFFRNLHCRIFYGEFSIPRCIHELVIDPARSWQMWIFCSVYSLSLSLSFRTSSGLTIISATLYNDLWILFAIVCNSQWDVCAVFSSVVAARTQSLLLAQHILWHFIYGRFYVIYESTCIVIIWQNDNLQTEMC